MKDIIATIDGTSLITTLSIILSIFASVGWLRKKTLAETEQAKAETQQLKASTEYLQAQNQVLHANQMKIVDQVSNTHKSNLRTDLDNANSRIVSIEEKLDTYMQAQDTRLHETRAWRDHFDRKVTTVSETVSELAAKVVTDQERIDALEGDCGKVMKRIKKEAAG